MVLVKKVRGFSPKWGENCYFADTAVIIGDVMMGNDCSVWFNAVVRGDVNFIKIGNRVNIQDGAIIHGTFETASTTIGNNVSVAHNAIVHGCTIDDNVLIGMGAIVMDNAHIGSNSIIAAGSVVLENTIVEPGSVYGGTPARKLKVINPELAGHLLTRISNNYLKYAGWYQVDDDENQQSD